jgi:hypothetical protein
MVAWVGTGILSKHTEHPCMMNVDNAPHAHKALQLPGYDVTSHPREQVENSGSPAPKGYPRLFCWRRVDDIVRDFSFLKFGPVKVRCPTLCTYFFITVFCNFLTGDNLSRIVLS